MKAHCIVADQQLKSLLHTYFTDANIEHVFLDVKGLAESININAPPDFYLVQPLFDGLMTTALLKQKINELYDASIDVVEIEKDLEYRFSGDSDFQILASDYESLNKAFNTYIKRINHKIQASRHLQTDAKQHRTILFVDDSPLEHENMHRIIQNSDYKVVHAIDGHEALEMIAHEMPSVIITDFEMPDLNGLELCKAVREAYPEYLIPIILTTSKNVPNILEKTYKMGADDFILKPLTGQKVLNKLNQYYRRERYDEKILIVDDSIMIQNVLKNAIMRSGYHVLIANNGFEALECVRTDRPDIVLTDINMPGMDGYTLIEEIRKTPYGQNLPCMIMSTLSSRYNQKLGESLGVEHYFVKPFQVDHVMNEIERYIVEKYRAIAVENQYMLETINALIKALESRDPATQGHTERVTQYSEKIAKMLKLRPSEVKHIILAAKLHDIGKIGISDTILLKPAALEHWEYELIKNHCENGRQILSPIKSLEPIIPLIYAHHERADGKGYPRGLEEDEIPLGAKIIAVADTYDAIISDRPYRKGRSTFEAAQILKENAGTQFSPPVVEAMLRVLAQEKKQKAI